MDAPKPSGWFHIVLNYLGPNNGEGVRIYYDGELKLEKSTPVRHVYSEGDRRIIIGKYYSIKNHVKHDMFASVQVDELLLFNEALNQDDISE